MPIHKIKIRVWLLSVDRAQLKNETPLAKEYGQAQTEGVYRRVQRRLASQRALSSVFIALQPAGVLRFSIWLSRSQRDLLLPETQQLRRYLCEDRDGRVERAF